MKQFLVTAYDFTDAGALQRRLTTRPHHLDMVRELKASGNFILGGAMLNDEGNPVGSVMVMQFDDEEEIAAWHQREPYLLQQVWETVDVKPFKVAEV